MSCGILGGTPCLSRNTTDDDSGLYSISCVRVKSSEVATVSVRGAGQGICIYCPSAKGREANFVTSNTCRVTKCFHHFNCYSDGGGRLYCNSNIWGRHCDEGQQRPVVNTHTIYVQ